MTGDSGCHFVDWNVVGIGGNVFTKLEGEADAVQSGVGEFGQEAVVVALASAQAMPCPVKRHARDDGKLDVGGLVGRDGTLTVSRDLGLREPYIGSVELVSGEVAEDLTAYLVESEQIPSACGLGVLVGTDRHILAAGGSLVQLLPGAPDELIQKIEDNLFLMDQLTTILHEDGAEEVIRQVLKGFKPEILSREEVSWRCPCSRERVSDALLLYYLKPLFYGKVKYFD